MAYLPSTDETIIIDAQLYEESLPPCDVPSHIWLSVSVENRSHIGRIQHLRSVESEIRFISFEPLLRGIDEVDLTDIAWAMELRLACERFNVAFFFKQWGRRTPKARGWKLDSIEYNAMPRIMGMRENHDIQLPS
ncbi:MAG: DUF5131 family protein [Aestuariivita sp.]|nr:DUF5131 family protein [Aestuariivita sp.]